MSIKNFIESLNDFDTEITNISGIEKTLISQKDRLKHRLETIINGENFAILDKNNLLISLINELKSSTQTSISTWDVKLQAALPMKALSEQYADRIIFLIFGKVNAGKSSFANFVTEQFATDQVKRFCFSHGKVEYFTDNQRFAEGVTETTATIQGVELGNKFVLLDSPGLHSVTDENGALTQQFVDSTDAVLWLTPSTSPGQVQELKDLQIELEKGKPLQPVITRSDSIEEDYCEETDTIVALVKNKSRSNRELQENDVLARVTDIELTAPVKPPVSISVHAYNKSDKTQVDLDESGLSALFESLITLVQEANAYKVGKAKNQMLIFLEKEILKPLQSNIVPKIDALGMHADNNIKILTKRKDTLTAMIVSDVSCEIPRIVNQHKDAQDKKAIASDLNTLIENRINSVLQQELSAFVSQIETVSSSLSSDKIGDFTDITIDITQHKGRTAKAATAGIGGIGGAAGGALAGAALGSVVPLVGTVAGGIVGGIAGSVLGGWGGAAVGDNFVDTEIITEKVGVSAEQIIDEITKAFEKDLPGLINGVFQNAIYSIQSVKLFTNSISHEIMTFEQQVQTLKETKL